MENRKRYCDGDCNHCPFVNHPNSRLLTYIFNKLYDKFGDDLYKIIQDACPNLTVCYDCKIDDFCHVEGCKLTDSAEKFRLINKGLLEKIT